MDAITHTILVCIVIYISYKVGQRQAFKEFDKFVLKMREESKKKPNPFFTRD
jgi:hypothetical protein|tara:strand:+ start:372 stop:527 length:156 start_codon:yes stop_codon:yes gene_type:complete